jgi:GT2 family glycosyltransferase
MNDVVDAAAGEALTSFSISLVTFDPDLGILTDVLGRLHAALYDAREARVLGDASLVIVDNGPTTECTRRLQSLLKAGWDGAAFPATLISGHGNIGYGQGHNKAIERSEADYHLVLNPDVLLAEDAITHALEFMDDNPDVGLLAPAVIDGNSSLHHLCKDYPSVLDLALRGFAPSFVRGWARARLARYELRDLDPNAVRRGVPLVSGSFMFFRRQLLEQTGGFSKDYFLYFEDFDLSLRSAQFAAIAYVPTVRIVHMGGYAFTKGPRHWWMFSRSACTFFSRHGWRWH